MSKRSYFVIYIAADGKEKTASIIGRSPLEVERFLKKRGGRVIHLELDDAICPKTRSIRNATLSVVLFILIGLAFVAYYWLRAR